MTSHDNNMISINLLASALNRVRSTAPADFTALPETKSAKTSPARQLTNPPSAADNAPWMPAQTPAMTAITTVTWSCQRKTVRKGLLGMLKVTGVARGANSLIVLKLRAVSQTGKEACASPALVHFNASRVQG